ncbi:transposase [Flavobacterium flavipallidum]|uniref:Transposase n=1 Tax=Flavobacterium flavipallidum TaxID=3139140 RepID=A0ABU9HPT7_9FLAO
MSTDLRKGSHTVSRLTCHVVWVTKYNWGQHFWASGYGVWSTGNITDKMVNEYLEHHRKKDDNENSNFILE